MFSNHYSAVKVRRGFKRGYLRGCDADSINIRSVQVSAFCFLLPHLGGDAQRAERVFLIPLLSKERLGEVRTKFGLKKTYPSFSWIMFSLP